MQLVLLELFMSGGNAAPLAACPEEKRTQLSTYVSPCPLLLLRSSAPSTYSRSL